MIEKTKSNAKNDYYRLKKTGISNSLIKYFLNVIDFLYYIVNRNLDSFTDGEKKRNKHEVLTTETSQKIFILQNKNDNRNIWIMKF